jgi:hypothetical protein
MGEWCEKIYMETLNKELSAMKTNSRLYMNEKKWKFVTVQLRLQLKLMKVIQRLLNKQEPN